MLANALASPVVSMRRFADSSGKWPNCEVSLSMRAGQCCRDPVQGCGKTALRRRTDIPIVSPDELLAAKLDRVLITLPDLLPEVSARFPDSTVAGKSTATDHHHPARAETWVFGSRESRLPAQAPRQTSTWHRMVAERVPGRSGPDRLVPNGVARKPAGHDLGRRLKSSIAGCRSSGTAAAR